MISCHAYICLEQILYIAGDSCQLWVCSPFVPILAPVGPLLQASLFLNSCNRGLLTKKLVPKKTFFFWQNFSTMRNSLSDPRDLKDEHKSSTASWLLSAFRTWRLKKVVLGIHWRLLATDVLSTARHQKMAWVSTRVGYGHWALSLISKITYIQNCKFLGHLPNLLLNTVEPADLGADLVTGNVAPKSGLAPISKVVTSKRFHFQWYFVAKNVFFREIGTLSYYLEQFVLISFWNTILLINSLTFFCQNYKTWIEFR